MRLEQERFKQQQRLRLEQIRLEEERKKHEKLQAERNALYNRQRLDMEAQFFSGGEDRQKPLSATQEVSRLFVYMLFVRQFTEFLLVSGDESTGEDHSRPVDPAGQATAGASQGRSPD